MLLAVIDVGSKPPADGLDVGIPRVTRGVGVAVVAGHFEHLLHDRRRSIMVYNIIRRGACGYVFGRLDKLDGGENDGKTQ